MVFLGVDQKIPAKQHQEALAAAAPAVVVSCDRKQGMHKASGISHLYRRGRNLHCGCQVSVLWHTQGCKNFLFSELQYFVPHLVSSGSNSTVSSVMVYCTVSASKSNIHNGGNRCNLQSICHFMKGQ